MSARAQVRAPRRARRGFTLIEVMVAVVILSIAVTGLAGMTMWAGRRSALAALQQGRLAVTARLVDQLSLLPFDSLAARAGCQSVTERPFPHRHCVTVSALSSTQRRVTIVIQPVSPLLPTDSVSFDRTAAPPPSPVS